MAVTLNYVPHPAQVQIHRARESRFRVVCTGRRFGKTLCLAAELLDRGGTETAGDYGWIAPTYNVAERGIEAFRNIAEGFIRVVGRMPTRIEFDGAAGPVRIWFLSADNADNIRGYGFQGIVVDEAASMPAACSQSPAPAQPVSPANAANPNPCLHNSPHGVTKSPGHGVTLRFQSPKKSTVFSLGRAFSRPPSVPCNFTPQHAGLVPPAVSPFLYFVIAIGCVRHTIVARERVL